MWNKKRAVPPCHSLTNERSNTGIRPLEDKTKSRREESNLRPTVYETVALPLSYAGMLQAGRSIPLATHPINRDNRPHGRTHDSRRTGGVCSQAPQ